MNKFDVPTFDWLNKDFVSKIVQNQFSWKANEFEVFSFDVSHASAKGENYLGTLLRVKAVVIKDMRNFEQYYVIKTAAGDGNSAEDLANAFGAYPKEMEMYQKILPAFHEIWKEVGYEIEFAPKCYGTFKEPVEIIVLEDLKANGFLMEDRCVGFDMNHTLLVTERLAQFHAASVIYLEKYEKFDEKFDNGYFSENIYDGEGKQYYSNLYKSFKTAVGSWPGFEKIYEKVSSWGEDVYLHGLNAAKLNSKDFRCLTHGDLWVNNIMFHKSKNGDGPKDLRFIDFQISTISSPSIDLHFLISSSLKDGDREKQFDTIVSHYHECLEKSLKQLNYSGHIPTLRELQLDMLKRSMVGNCIILEGLTEVLKSRDSTIEFQTIATDSDEGEEVRRQLFANPIYMNIAQKYLNFLYKRGMLDLP